MVVLTSILIFHLGSFSYSFFYGGVRTSHSGRDPFAFHIPTPVFFAAENPLRFLSYEIMLYLLVLENFLEGSGKEKY